MLLFFYCRISCKDFSSIGHCLTHFIFNLFGCLSYLTSLLFVCFLWLFFLWLYHLLLLLLGLHDLNFLFFSTSCSIILDGSLFLSTIRIIIFNYFQIFNCDNFKSAILNIFSQSIFWIFAFCLKNILFGQFLILTTWLFFWFLFSFCFSGHIYLTLIWLYKVDIYILTKLI